MSTSASQSTGVHTIGAVQAALGPSSVERIQRALDYAKRLYDWKFLSPLSTWTLQEHAERSARFLLEFCRDEDAMIACLLQHAVPAEKGSLDEIEKEFGKPVRDLVSRVHLLSHLYSSEWKRSIDDMKLMLTSISDDIRVLLITLSSLSVLLEDVAVIKKEHRAKLCRQSLQLFAPVAARLGIYALKYRIERFAFPECYPIDAERIEQQLLFQQKEHGGFLPLSAHAVVDFLRSEGIEAEVMAREKQPYSIFRKMNSKGVNALEKIYDLFAIRVIVPTVEDCYQALGLLHRMGTPISSRFKDYISFPKPNGYKSLHTCIIGLPKAPRTAMVEVQIRTRQMHHQAEYGVAAHWLYKEGVGGGKVLQSAEKLGLTEMLMKQQSLEDGEEATQISSLVNHIYALTPAGDIIELPDGGTPLDFAFMVHTDLGLQFKSARVNGRIVPIDMKLENGDVVEIMTHKHPQPTLQWLKVLRTPSARNKLKSYFFSHNRPEFLVKGKDAVNRELRGRGIKELDPSLSLFSIVNGRSLSVREREDILVKVGMGALRPAASLRGIPAEKRGTAQKKKAATSRLSRLSAVLKKKHLVKVVGETLPLPYRFAKCCAPDKDKSKPEVYGIVTKNGRITVHRSECGMIKNVTPTRKLQMEWM